MELKEFIIPFSGLKLGKHGFTYKIGRTFFESFGYQEFNSATITVDASLDKSTNLMELDLASHGTVNVDCDSTGEPFDLKTNGSLHLVIKFAEAYDDTDDELLLLPHGESRFNIAQYVYEMIVLGLPQKRTHPGVEDGSLQSEILEKLEELKPRPKEETNKKTIDPRWDKLKKLLTDK